MFNPSTADAELDDPTIRRCVGFSQRMRYGGLVVVNLFAVRSPDPMTVRQVSDPAGPDNDFWVRYWASKCPLTMAAWGFDGRVFNADRYMLRTLGEVAPFRVMCLGTTKGGDPRHPLFVRSDQAAVPYLKGR